jgi:hypothetical protein
MMKKIVMTVLLACTTWLHAAEWVMVPIAKPDFKFNFTLAGTLGEADPKDSISTLDKSGVTGLQLSFECPWFSSPKGNLRTHFNHNSYDLTAGKIKTFEINPHWFNTKEGDGISYGPGLGAGYIWNDVNSDKLYSVNALFDVEYRKGKLFAGIGVRYMWTQSKSLAGLNGFDHSLVQAKLCVNFY